MTDDDDDDDKDPLALVMAIFVIATIAGLAILFVLLMGGAVAAGDLWSLVKWIAPWYGAIVIGLAVARWWARRA